jgi:26S proteasome regulatory subunit N2
MLAYAHDTQHEKIIRGLSLGLALTMYGRCDNRTYALASTTRLIHAAAAAGLAMWCDERSPGCVHDGGHCLLMSQTSPWHRREEGAQTLIEQMTRDLDPIIRYGGMFTIALAYRGTANNAAVQQLLHFAVSDVNDDVRRAAVLCLGFLLLDSPQQCPRLVSLLVRRLPRHR